MVSLVLTLFLLCTCVTLGKSGGKVPAILIFGDSTVDTGNNNFIWTAFKADHVPYGLHFSSSNWRFSDRELVSDMLASALGIKQLVPPFLNPTLSTDDLMTGVCFASAASGYDDFTVAVMKAIPMSKQPQMFQQYVRRLQQAWRKEVCGGRNGSTETPLMELVHKRRMPTPWPTTRSSKLCWTKLRLCFQGAKLSMLISMNRPWT